jgi:Ca2+-binding RTX toxin-like protein
MATIQGSNFSEVLHGHSVQDYIYAYGGNDTVYASGGNDYVDGGTGNDTIIGGEGADGLTGGAGYDVFKYNSASETWYDAIWDFNKAYDYVDLSGIDAKSYELFNPGTWGNQAFNWKGQLVGQGLSKGDLGYQLVGNDTYLYGNTDSDAAYEVQLRIAGHHHLSTADIYL